MEKTALGAEFAKISLVLLLPLRIGQHLGHKRIIVMSPVKRILPAGVALHAAPGGSAQGVVVVVRNKEDLVFAGVGAVEIQVKIIAIVPIVVPHTHGNVHGVSLEKQIHIHY